MTCVHRSSSNLQVSERKFSTHAFVPPTQVTQVNFKVLLQVTIFLHLVSQKKLLQDARIMLHATIAIQLVSQKTLCCNWLTIESVAKQVAGTMLHGSFVV